LILDVQTHAPHRPAATRSVPPPKRSRAWHRLLHWQAMWGWLLLWLVVVISLLALMPAPPRAADTGWDKLNHFCAFAALGCVARLWLGQRRHAAWLGLLGLLAYGAAIELLQSLVPSRSADWADLLADAVGVLVGMATATALLALAERRGRRHSAEGDNTSMTHR
jgi:VanZ family protein